MSIDSLSLAALGWRATHSQQLTLAELERAFPARIANIQRNSLALLCEHGSFETHPPRSEEPLSARFAVGDWLLIERAARCVLRRLEPYSCIERTAAGRKSQSQLIAANVDTLLIATSCNDDFNLSRLERYLALAYESRVAPLVVLTKADLVDESSRFIAAVNEIAPLVPVIALNALDHTSATALTPWLGTGQTVALVGSSGVGKSTLTNTLCMHAEQATSSIRTHDSKGRHTTTARQLFRLPSGAWLIDTPGMRELSLGDVTEGIEATFADISALAQRCRFRDCSHREEKGCGVTAAIEEGSLDERRLANFLKLQREAAHANATLAERRDRERRFGRMRHDMERQRRKMREGR